MKKTLFIANWAQGDALSGADRIWIELFKRWKGKLDVFVSCSEEAVSMCHKLGVTDIRLESVLPRLKSRSLTGNLLIRSLQAVKTVPDAVLFDIVYSSSDFWPDVIPALRMKLRKKNIRWIAGFYLFAPAPWHADSPYRGRRFFIGLFYWFTQRPVYWLVRNFADVVFVTSEPDVKRFVTARRDRKNVIVVRGGVDIGPSRAYSQSNAVIPVDSRKYDAVFIGRFHYQKGVFELVDIWKRVCESRPGAKLVLIGSGPLEQAVREKIGKCGLTENIELAGFRQGQDAYEIFKRSRVVVHPATYDSGGMASAEAMAWGLPGVSFDLESLKTYYPQGMLKTPCFDRAGFAGNIIKLLGDRELYKKTSEQALALIRQQWDWDARAQYLYEQAGVYGS
jgi:glycosyltransferase involved in cell wall biosynthesis